MIRVVTMKELFFEELNRQLREEEVRVVPSPEIKVIEPTQLELRLAERGRQDDAA
jgi:hypothetical protein